LAARFRVGPTVDPAGHFRNVVESRIGSRRPAIQPKITPTITVMQSEIPGLLAGCRVTAYPVIVRAERQQLGGGFGDQSRHPFTWTVLLQVDGQWARVESVRGAAREWGSLDRLERWLRGNGFRYFWLQNDLDPHEEPEGEPYPLRPGLK
jgi:hypothetical protein